MIKYSHAISSYLPSVPLLPLSPVILQPTFIPCQHDSFYASNELGLTPSGAGPAKRVLCKVPMFGGCPATYAESDAQL